MDVDKELENIFSDPLLEISSEEKKLFDVPKDMMKATRKRREHSALCSPGCIKSLVREEET